MFTNSIRWRLQLWLGFLLLCLVSGFAVTVYQLQRINQFKQIDDDLERRVRALSASVRGGPPPFGERRGRPPGDEDLGRPPFGRGSRSEFDGGPGRPPRGGPDGMRRGDEMRFGPRGFGPREIRLSPEVGILFEEANTNGFYFAVWSRTGTLLKFSTNTPDNIPRPELPENSKDNGTHIRSRDNHREAYYFTEIGECVLAGRSIVADFTAMRRFKLLLLAAGGTVLALGLGGGWWLTTRAIRPVEEISAAASRISAGNLSERVTVAEPDNELGRLAGVLNSTFARLESAFGRQKQFTADAAHELRTPLAVIISEAQTALARERNAMEYRETVEACLDTAQQMRRLTDSLLELARSDAGEEQLHREPVDLAELTRNCIERIRPLAEQRSIEIKTEIALATAFGHVDQLGQVITNLLTNAIHYNKPNGEIRVSTRVDNGVAFLVIADTGIGISSEDLPQVFERFYRADKSRSRSEGRNGLGLAICKAIVDAHSGTIEVTSEPDLGTTFTVRLPIPPNATA